MESTNKNLLSVITTVLAAIGALNWGLVGGLNFNLVAYLFGPDSNLSKIIYILIGLSGAYLLIKLVASLTAQSSNT